MKTKCKLSEIHDHVHEGLNEIELTDYEVKIKFKVVKK
jgi:hypothetical protein